MSKNNGDPARIEVIAIDRNKLVMEPLSSEITQTLKSYGFKYVTLDIQGNRTDSLNESINIEEWNGDGEIHG